VIEASIKVLIEIVKGVRGRRVPPPLNEFARSTVSISDIMEVSSLNNVDLIKRLCKGTVMEWINSTLASRVRTEIYMLDIEFELIVIIFNTSTQSPRGGEVDVNRVKLTVISVIMRYEFELLIITFVLPPLHEPMTTNAIIIICAFNLYCAVFLILPIIENIGIMIMVINSIISEGVRNIGKIVIIVVMVK